MEDNKELIWVSAELAKEYKELSSVEEQEKAVKKIIKHKRLDLEEEQELLSESLLLFKSVCLAHRKGLEKVYREQSDALNTLWEDMGDVSSQIGYHVDKISDQVNPLKKEVQSLSQQVTTLKKEIDGLNLYIPERFVEIASLVGRMDGKTKLLLRDLLGMDAKTRS